MIHKIIYLTIGGAAGTLLRYAVSYFSHRVWGPHFPYGTMAVNLIGCLLLGCFVNLAERYVWDPSLKLLLMAGFCGAFTTFSTFIFENVDFIQQGQFFSSLNYVMLSVVLGFGCFYLGFFLPAYIARFNS